MDTNMMTAARVPLLFHDDQKLPDFFTLGSAYQSVDPISQPHLIDSEMAFPFDSQMEAQSYLQHNLQSSSRDEISQFIDESAFEQVASSPKLLDINADNFLSSPRGARDTNGFSPYIPTHNKLEKAEETNSWRSEPQTVSLAVVTSGFNDESDRHTTVQHGQLTPGESPASPGKTTGHELAEAKAKDIHSEHPEDKKLENAPRNESNANKFAKKARKPRKSSKKKLTAEQEAEKREIFLKRNREAAHKCRIKKKNQNEEIAQKVKALDADNAMKGLQVAKLKREVETLKAILLPHYRECNDEQLVAYMDATTLSPHFLTEDLRLLQDVGSLESDQGSDIHSNRDDLNRGSVSSWASAVSEADEQEAIAGSSSSTRRGDHSADISAAAG